MTAINRSYASALNGAHLDLALRSLAIRLEENRAEVIELVVCGGSALILTGLIKRTTQDVDVVALMRQGSLCSPEPLPPSLLLSVQEVAEDLNLPSDWLNNHPSHGEGGLFQMGLPAGFAERLTRHTYGPLLTVHFIHRIDQIHFKLYASVDRGGYHITDLIALKPTPDEIESAARWAMTHDVSEGFVVVLKRLLRSIGYDTVAERL
ncbi:MAG TPA: DUF6036 family nucleotidyltransferase [Kiritimatiellia bacterium]|nr:DUF6036 family nucleotidyltransferase [Kiritimatiellia bacterium]HPS08579.1 DUF6036 family nucleotidyltransferase [Kiritimatiellia bacterium]